jgi:hypothetical protein
VLLGWRVWLTFAIKVADEIPFVLLPMCSVTLTERTDVLFGIVVLLTLSEREPTTVLLAE